MASHPDYSDNPNDTPDPAHEVDVIERRPNRRGGLDVRVRCPFCGVRHWFEQARARAQIARCPRTQQIVPISHGGR